MTGAGRLAAVLLGVLLAAFMLLVGAGWLPALLLVVAVLGLVGCLDLFERLSPPDEPREPYSRVDTTRRRS